VSNCKVGTVVESLPTKYVDSLTVAFDDKGNISSYNIMNAFDKAGFNIGERTIDRHRSHKCICYKTKGETNE